MKNASLGDRMKGYESVPNNKLITKMPVIIRLDGKAFHTYTKNMEKPFSGKLHELRKVTVEYLMKNIQGCILAYSQSDEISLVLKDWQSYNTSAWFDNKIQKICSVSASMCTAVWNKNASELGIEQVAMFDARCFNLPLNEVINYLIWRQQDWERNSIQMLSRVYYSHKECHRKSCKDLVTMLENEHGVVWGNLPSVQKQGEVFIDGVMVNQSMDFIFNNERLAINLLLNRINGE